MNLSCSQARIATTLLLGPCLGGGLSAQQPPAAPTVDAMDSTAAGVVADPYRWLEDTGDPDVRAWYVAERRHTESLLRDEGGYVDLRDRLHGLLSDDIVFPPTTVGSLLFFERQVADARGAADAYVVALASSPDGPAQTILDPRDVREEDESWNRFTDISPDPAGRRVLVGLPDGGGGAVLRIWDRMTASFWPQRLHARPGTATWLSRELLMYARMAESAGSPGLEEVVVHDLATGTSRVAFTGPRPGPVGATPSPDGALLIVTHRDPATPPSPWPGYQGPTGLKNVWVGTVALEDGVPGSVRPLLPDRDGRYRILGVRGRTLWLLTTPDDGLGRILTVELDANGGAPHTVYRARDQRIVDATLVGDRVAVGLDRGLDGSILLMDRNGTILRRVDPPQPGPVASLEASPDGRFLYFRWSSFLRRGPVYRVDLTTGHGDVFQPVGPSLAGDAYTVRRVEYQASDGANVPLFLVHPSSRRPEGGWPTLLYAYGGWGWNVAPWFHQRWATWLESGGAVAIANVRGGGEYGQAWHDAGKKGNRENAVTDVHAAAEWLVREGHTSRERLGLLGLSAGGPTVGSALIRRPELFGAAVLEVSLLDLVRFGVAREFGDPSLPGPDEASAALTYSPYHQLDDAVCLPPTLVVTSEDDNLFPQALKFTARARRAQRCPAPVLLHVGEREGHLPVGTAGAERHLNELIFFRKMLDRPSDPDGSGG